MRCDASECVSESSRFLGGAAAGLDAQTKQHLTREQRCATRYRMGSGTLGATSPVGIAAVSARRAAAPQTHTLEDLCVSCDVQHRSTRVVRSEEKTRRQPTVGASLNCAINRYIC